MEHAQRSAVGLEEFLRSSDLTAGEVVKFEGIPLLVESIKPPGARPGSSTKLRVLAAEFVPCPSCGQPLPYRGNCFNCGKRNLIIPLVVLLALVAVVVFLTRSPRGGSVKGSPSPAATPGLPTPSSLPTPDSTPPEMSVSPSPSSSSTPELLYSPSPSPTPSTLISREQLGTLLNTDREIDTAVSDVAARLNAADLNIAAAQKEWEKLAGQVENLSAELNRAELGEFKGDMDELVGLQRQRIQKLLEAARVESAEGLEVARPLWDEQISYLKAYRNKREVVEQFSSRLP